MNDMFNLYKYENMLYTMRIPAERMKRRREHLVPLPSQAVGPPQLAKSHRNILTSVPGT